MGHVDHGKTTLLDAFRTDFNRCGEEYGEITQSIGAFTITLPKICGTELAESKATFIDTPGHEAFSNMRVRGAKVTDMIILVISAIESIKRQTLEVIDLAKASHVPMIIAINKIDRPEANVESTMLDLASYDLVPEQLGGNTIVVPISAKEKVNINLLSEKIAMVAREKLNLIEDFTVPA